ncbi:fasciclin domain-containing protein [Qipengyuania sp.]|uniref:fasciclin domain-containing protein n=1 Tax=Qipengyuania sp. TaxID=2004515 RepID=UPI00351231A7
MTTTWKPIAAPLALALLGSLAACTAEESPESDAIETIDEGTQTLASVLAGDDRFKSLREAVEQSDLSGIFDGPASYTLLAPDDPAFAALGDKGKTLLEAEQRPVLVAILRDHLLPGHLTPEAIEAAIERNGGPVTMTTLGRTEMTFSRSGDAIVAATGEGVTARVGESAVAAINGVILPIDTVLLPREETPANSPG